MLITDFAQFCQYLDKGKRILGIDHGDQSLGLALSDPTHTIATAHSTLVKPTIAKRIGALKQLIREEDIIAMVIGLPLSMQGEETEQCKKVRSFVERISKDIDLPIFLQDERFSSKAADRALQATSMTWQKRAKVDDQMAASFMLQGLLDRL